MFGRSWFSDSFLHVFFLDSFQTGYFQTEIIIPFL